jgi:hypothetical protein
MMQEPPATSPPALRQTSLRFKIGIFFLLANMPIGYGGLALGAAISAATHSKVGIYLGVAVYVFSWVMLGAGLLLSGKEGYQHARDLWRRFLHRRRAQPPD